MNTEKEPTLTPTKRFWQLLHVYRHEVRSIYIYAFFSSLIMLSVPLGVQTIINLIQGAQITTSWIVVVVLVILGILTSGFLRIMQQAVSENIQQKIFVNAAFDFAYRIPKLKTEAVDKSFMPEVINRFFDTIIVQKGVSKILLDYSIAAIQIILGLILLMFYHPFFISFGIILIILIFLIIRFTFAKGLETSITESKYKYKLVHWLEDIGRSLKTFKLAGVSTLPLDKTDIITNEWVKYRKAHFKVLIIQFVCMVGFKALIAAGLLITGGLLVFNQQMNIGQFVAAEIIILTILNSIEKLFTGSETFFDVLTSLTKLGEVTDLPLEASGSAVLEPTPVGISVELKNVSFNFPSNHTKSLNLVNLNVAAGERVAIVGPNGAGKSTLLKMMAGLYDEYDGVINLNGMPMRSLNIPEVRDIITNNLKENSIFAGSVMENITLGKQGVRIDEIVQICEMVDLMTFVETLPNGLDTQILSEGNTLNASIKQKIVLARCMVGNPKLILMEDNFEDLDRITQSKLNNYLFESSPHCTLIIATHRKDILQHVDKILVMENGTVIDSGTFTSLQAYKWINSAR